MASTLVIPLLVRNPTAETQTITIAADLPAGWTAQTGTGKVSIGARQTAATRVEINLPAGENEKEKKKAAQEITVRAESGGRAVGTVKLRVELRARSLPQ